MKTVFKAVLVVVIAMIAVEANAQNRFKLGYVGANMKAKGTGATTTYSQSGFLVGFDHDLALPTVSGLSVRPGVNFVYATGKMSGDKLTEMDVYVPIDVKYAYEIDNALGVYAFAGPRFDVGLSSKISGGDESYKYSGDYYTGKYETTYEGQTTTEEGEGSFNRFDLKFGLGAGVKYNNLSFEVGYDLGLLNRYREASDGYSLKRNRFVLTVGYSF
ncbi:MAG: PorT family protein [Rikenellaceae bacterium]|nr:PorT family protein [Rikenellaceae bacterium]